MVTRKKFLTKFRLNIEVRADSFSFTYFFTFSERSNRKDFNIYREIYHPKIEIILNCTNQSLWLCTKLKMMKHKQRPLKICGNKTQNILKLCKSDDKINVWQTNFSSIGRTLSVSVSWVSCEIARDNKWGWGWKGGGGLVLFFVRRVS